MFFLINDLMATKTVYFPEQWSGTLQLLLDFGHGKLSHMTLSVNGCRLQIHA